MRLLSIAESIDRLIETTWYDWYPIGNTLNAHQQFLLLHIPCAGL